MNFTDLKKNRARACVCVCVRVASFFVVFFFFFFFSNFDDKSAISRETKFHRAIELAFSIQPSISLDRL